MPERLVHRTWSVRTVSGPFPVPLFGHRRRHRPKPSTSSPSRNGDRRHGVAASGNAQSPPTDPMDEAESDLSSFVRRSLPRERAGYDDVHDGDGEDGGTYVSLSWIRLPVTDDLAGGDEEDTDSRADASHAGRKRPRSKLTGEGAEATGRFQSGGEKNDDEVRHHHHHLHVHVWVRDEEAAQLVLCFSRFVVPSSPKEETTTTSHPPEPRQSLPVDSFAYVLVRGSPAAYLPVLSWLEETSGCRVGPKPFRPSPADIGRAAADWTLLARRRLLLARGGGGGSHDDHDNNGRNGGRGTPGGDDDDGDEAEASVAASRMLRPLEVTFDAPRSVAEAGLEKITLTVPPTSLWRLCCAIEDASPPLPSSTPRPLPSRRRGTTPSSERDEDGRRFPILSALHSYFRESFRVDLSSFPLARAASSAAVIGRDGRLKPLDVGLVGAVLDGVRRMVEGRVGNVAGAGGGGGVIGSAAGRYDDEEDE